MKLITLLIMISLIIESTFLPFPLVLILILFLSLGLGEKAYWLLFSIGIIFDLLTIRLLGIDSLIFLLLSWVIIRYNQKIQLKNYILVSILLITITDSYSFIFYRRWFSVLDIFLILILSYFLLLSLPRIFPEKIGSKIKLAV